MFEHLAASANVSILAMLHTSSLTALVLLFRMSKSLEAFRCFPQFLELSDMHQQLSIFHLPIPDCGRILFPGTAGVVTIVECKRPLECTSKASPGQITGLVSTLSFEKLSG
ncbi:hypothetical protein Tco_0551396 [Tanacetum coccineum]